MPQFQFSIEATTSSQYLWASRKEEKITLQQVFTLTGHNRRSKSRREFNERLCREESLLYPLTAHPLR
jgi:hypothetical protein